jgi:hypothetical protein
MSCGFASSNPGRNIVALAHSTKPARRRCRIIAFRAKHHLLGLLVNPVPGLGARGPKHRHAMVLAEERIDEDASDGFHVGQADGAGCTGRCVLMARPRMN